MKVNHRAYSSSSFVTPVKEPLSIKLDIQSEKEENNEKKNEKRDNFLKHTLCSSPPSEYELFQ